MGSPPLLGTILSYAGERGTGSRTSRIPTARVLPGPNQARLLSVRVS